jgi:hypothetical protein
MIDLIAIAKGLAVWFVPLAVVAYIVLYFVMAIIIVICWNGRDSGIRQFWRKFARPTFPDGNDRLFFGALLAGCGGIAGWFQLILQSKGFLD